MSYLKNDLLGNEITILEPKKNPIFLILRWIWGVLGCWLLLIPTILAIKFTIKYCTIEFLVTDKRVMEKQGWLATKTKEMSLNKIENITVEYTIFGKIFNYGKVCIQGANHDSIYFNYVKNAENVRREINKVKK